MNLLSCSHIGFRDRYSVRGNLVYRIFFQPPDIDGIVDEIPAAAFLAGMLTDHSAGRRQRIVPADHIYSPRVIFFSDQRDISRDIHVRRTEIDTRHLLTDFPGTAAVFYMTEIFFFQSFQAPGTSAAA